jgi:AraC-like DNA-binding protein
LHLSPGAYYNLHNPQIYETLNELVDEYTKTPPYYEQVGIQKVISLLTILARSVNKEEKVLLPEINRIIFDNPNIKNPELAEHYHISQSTLLRYFKMKYNMTLTEYKQSATISRAKDLLTKTAESTVSIANLLGFDDVYNFYHFFKRYTGLTPSEYRKKHTYID